MSEHPSLRTVVRGLPSAAWLLFVGVFINRFGAFVIPFLVLYVTRKGYSPSQAGLAAGSYGLGHLAAAWIGGWMADRIGRRYSIAISMFSSAGAMLALAHATQLWHFIVLAALAGLCAELYRPASSALVADLVPEHDRRVVAFSIYRLLINAGFAAGPATAGFLAKYSFSYLFYGDAITSFIFGCIALAFLPDGVRAAASSGGWRAAIRIARRDAAFLRFLFATVLVTIVVFQFSSTVALHAKDSGLSTAAYGALISINGVLIIFLELPITSWTRRQPQRPMVALGYLITGIGIATTGLAHAFATLSISIVVWTIGEMIHAAVAVAYVANLAREDLRGRYMGLLTSCWSIGLMIGPSLGTAIYQYKPAVLWVMCGVFGLAASALVLVGDEKAAAVEAN